MRTAVIGLDGFDTTFDYKFLRKMPFIYGFMEEHGSTNEVKCSTAPHSAPSWFTIFTGVPQSVRGDISMEGYHDVHGFYRFTSGDKMVMEKREGDKPWNIETIDQEAKRVGGFIWHNVKNSCAQGIMCIQPHYSYRCQDMRAYYDGIYDDKSKGYEYINNFMKVFRMNMKLRGRIDLWCGVIQIVDQIHHHHDRVPPHHNSAVMRHVDKAVKEITTKFDNIIMISDHGMPVPTPTVYEHCNVKIHSHRPYCFMTSNTDMEISETLDFYKELERVVST